jgi:hypothetical protein
MFAERESHAVHFLTQHLTRDRVVSYIVNLRAKARGDKLQEEYGAWNESVSELRKAIGDNWTLRTNTKSKIFISYSHRDSRWKDRLEVHLKSIVYSGIITY